MTRTEQRVYECIAAHQPIHRRDIAVRLGMSVKTVATHLHNLKPYGLVFASTKGASATWSTTPPLQVSRANAAANSFRFLQSWSMRAA